MKKLILAIITIFLTGCSSISKTGVITYNDALKLINDNNAIIIDVRTESEYNEGHIEDAILMTLDTIYYYIRIFSFYIIFCNAFVYCI